MSKLQYTFITFLSLSFFSMHGFDEGSFDGYLSSGQSEAFPCSQRGVGRMIIPTLFGKEDRPDTFLLLSDGQKVSLETIEEIVDCLNNGDGWMSISGTIVEPVLKQNGDLIPTWKINGPSADIISEVVKMVYFSQKNNKFSIIPCNAMHLLEVSVPRVLFYVTPEELENSAEYYVTRNKGFGFSPSWGVSVAAYTILED